MNPPIPTESTLDFIVSDEEREAILSGMPSGYRSRYRDLLDRHDHPKENSPLTEANRKELLQLGLIKTPSALLTSSGVVSRESGKDIGGGARGLAGYVSRNFPGVHVTHTTIVNWRRGKGLPHNCKENFPPADGDGKTPREDVDRWAMQYLATGGAADSGGEYVDDLKRLQKARADTAEMERDEMKRASSEKWQPTVIAENYSEGFCVTLGERLNKWVEDAAGLRRLNRETLAEMGFTPEQIAMFDGKIAVKYVEANEAFKAEMAAGQKELVKQLAQQRREQMAGK